MTRNGPARRPDRREFLALSGAAALSALAGCTDLLPGSGTETIDGDALAELASEDAPTVPETLPVEIEASFVDEQRSAAESKLDDVPAPFDEAEIPNGVIRERLNDEYDSARESIRGLSDASTAYERLGRATQARTSAHEVLIAWRAIDAEVAVSDLREERSAVREDVDAFASRWSYVGDDPVRAAVVHAEIERDVRGARNWLSFREGELERAEGRPLELADVAVDVERARIDVAVASHLLDRLRARVDGETDRRDRLESAREELREQVRTRADALPSEEPEDPTSLVDRDVDRTAGVQALSRIASDARRHLRGAAEGETDPSLATDVVVAARALVHLRAFEHLRERIEDGDDVAVESAADVEALRSDAVSAVEAAREADRGPMIADAILPRLAREIQWTDDRFERASGSIPVGSVARDASEYVVVAETCRAVPPASADAEAALRQS